MEKDRTEIHNLADNFYRFGDPAWKQSRQKRLEERKARRETLNQLFQKQGKTGLE